MAQKPKLPEGFSTTPEGVRTELIGEINSKVPIWVFVGAVALFGAILLYLYTQIDSIRNNKLEDLQKRITVVETKSAPNEDLQKRITILETRFTPNFDNSQKFQEDLQKRVTILETKFDSRQESQPKKH
jgi:hypothetical protein